MKHFSLSILLSALAFAYGCSESKDGPAAGSTATQKVRPKLADLVKLSKDKIDLAIGNPITTEKTTSPRGGKMLEMLNCEYKSETDPMTIRIEYLKRKTDFEVETILFTFDEKTDWKGAVKKTDLAAKQGSKLSYSEFYAGAGKLKGHNLQGWIVTFSGYKSREPSNGILLNEADNGLPLLTIQSEKWGQ